MSVSQTEIEQHIKRHGVRQLTALDNTGLYFNSGNYSKKSKQIVLDQQAKAVKKAKERKYF